MRVRGTPVGEFTPDGSPVEVYLRLPPRGEAELVHAAIASGAEILELGCGVGRITHELVRLGHPVIAVDERQPFAAILLDDAELDAALRRVGLTLSRTLDERGAWVEARLYSDA